MSNADKEASNNLPQQYRVGYKRPPAEHRFRKGQSGNPRGRPKGSRNQPKVDTGHGMRAAEEYLKQEAYRTVTVREGENYIELPAIQAIFRAMGVSAMKGNRFAQKAMADLVTNLEKREAQDRFELFGNMVEYKHKWTEEIERCERLGRPVPEPIPHPHDIILNPSNGGVRIEGPQTREQKLRLEEVLQRRAEAQEEVSYFAEKYRRSRSEKMKAFYLDHWHWEQRMFDIINDAVPKRYKAKLENRSYREGASREGSALEELCKDREMRSEYIGD
ncbi:DUF5681 domain-containing protein [Aurantiacibacter gilvus]|uniref:DUF5681 domain-containing protein n=1 Tax=Aurantiacibacter gilvus TaxID=3139141 RepID=A0ABU9IA36_9SPHN